MDIQEEKIELMRLLLDTESREVIERVKCAFKGVDYDFYNDLPDYVKADIDAALKEIEKGDVYEHEHVMHDIKVKYGIKN
jgi:hypothetical protein